MENLFFKKTLEAVYKNITNSKSLKDEILGIWAEIKKDYSKHALPSFLNRGTLYIDVEDSNWLYFCFLNKEEIKKDLKKLFVNGKIKDIKFQVVKK